MDSQATWNVAASIVSGLRHAALPRSKLGGRSRRCPGVADGCPAALDQRDASCGTLKRVARLQQSRIILIAAAVFHKLLPRLELNGWPRPLWMGEGEGGSGRALLGKRRGPNLPRAGHQEKLSFGDSREFRARQSSGFDKQYLRSSTMIA